MDRVSTDIKMLIAQRANSYRNARAMMHALPDLKGVELKMLDRLKKLLTYLSRHPSWVVVVGNVSEQDRHNHYHKQKTHYNFTESDHEFEFNPGRAWTIIGLHETRQPCTHFQVRVYGKGGDGMRMSREEVLAYFAPIAVRGNPDGSMSLCCRKRRWTQYVVDGPLEHYYRPQPSFIYEPPTYSVTGHEVNLM